MVGDVLGMLGIVDAGTSKGVGAIGFISGLGSTCEFSAALILPWVS